MFYLRPQFLSVLKDQILEHEVNKKRDFWVRSQESDVSIAIDRNTLEEERQSRIKKRVYLQQFRDANKEVSCEACADLEEGGGFERGRGGFPHLVKLKKFNSHSRVTKTIKTLEFVHTNIGWYETN